MNKPFVFLTFFAVLASRAEALDLDYWVSVDAGAAAAFGGDVPAALAEFGDSVGAPASVAPVLGAAFGAGAEAGLSGGLRGGLRAVGGLELRRLGYAFWSPGSGASSWLSLWAAGLRLGLRYRTDPWFVGAGGSALAPVSGIDQATAQGGSGLVVAYDVGAGRAIIPGAYLEAGIVLGRGLAVGKVEAVPSVGVFAGAWPGGIVDDVEAWQVQAGLSVSLNLRKRTAR